ncbi:hypothetical protein KNE206_04120 [Kitasatospora sp. NE20-6]|uniref:PP2C family protein-serine/threonine phosphatase n=1 Tax=Kitasatospora sp. NE20-6 TaxID=2859066 RepID=UPI0034DBB19B
MRIGRSPSGNPSAGLSPRAAIVLGAAVLAVPPAVGSLVFADLHASSARTVEVIRERLDPATTAARHLGSLVNGQAASQRGYLLTGDPLYLAELNAGTADAAETFAELNSRATAVPGLHLDLAQLEHELATWLSGLDPAGAPAAYAGPDRVSAAALHAGDPHRLLATTGHMTERLIEEQRSLQSATSSEHRSMLLVVTLLTAVLLTAVALLFVLGSRRFVTPLTALERRVQEAARGDTGGGSHAHAGWFGGVFAEVEQVHTRMKELRWDARRHREALVQHGEAALGVFEFLVSHTGPGPGVDAAGHLVAAEGLVAGDFWDVLPLPGGATGLVQGDVSGHGVQAGLLGAAAKARASSALRLGHGPRVAVESAWGAVAEEAERFVTLAVVVVDPAAGTVEWVNAGHEPPVLRRADGTVEYLGGTGPLVGAVVDPADRPWRTARTSLGAGDLLVLATDGLTEARGPRGEEFGADRVARVLQDPGADDPASAITGLYLAVDRHGIDWQRDDVTVLAARLTP